jgi:tRNA dimethylallyltransferase
MKEKLLAIVGPTAVGKTKLSIHLAKEFKGEIISGDSMQVYRGMDVGTAKIKPEEQEGISHYLLDILDPREDFSVSEFQQLALEKMKELQRSERLPILVGGTGLYVQSVTHQFQFAEAGENEVIREKWQTYLDHHGPLALHQELSRKDPGYAQELHPNNSRRVIRALEVHETTGKSMAEFHGEWERESPFHLVMIGLTMERSILYERINQRVDQMISEGLVEEVQRLLHEGVPESSISLHAIGYKEIIGYLHGDTSLEEAIELLKRNTRRFAKRQLTWFRRMKEVKWFDVTDLSKWSSHEEIITKYVQESFRQ